VYFGLRFRLNRVGWRALMLWVPTRIEMVLFLLASSHDLILQRCMPLRSAFSNIVASVHSIVVLKALSVRPTGNARRFHKLLQTSGASAGAARPIAAMQKMEPIMYARYSGLNKNGVDLVALFERLHVSHTP
jgi:hypothetical protein